MKTFNIRYRSVDKLKVFLDDNGINNQKNIMIQVFTSILDTVKLTKVLTDIKSLLPKSCIIGCSSDGEIVESNILDHNTVISITIFESTTIKCAMIKNSENSFNDGKKLSSLLVADNTKVFILFATFKNINANLLLKGMHQDNSDVIISGALAGDGGMFKNSFVFIDDTIVDDGIVALSLSGESLIASNHYKHEWEPISKEFTVSDSSLNHLKSIEDKPAKELYLQYIGKEIKKSISYISLQFPFILKRKGINVTLGCFNDLKDGSLLFSSNIKNDETIQIAFANLSLVKDGIKTIFNDISNNPVESIFIYSSSARKRFIQHLNAQEIEAISQIAPCFGFYGYGEFFSNAKLSHFMNHTLGILTLSESSKKVKVDYKKYKRVAKPALEYETINILTNIAQVSSKELEVLNKKLNYKIKDGIRENRKKESIMIHNSRLAQLGEMLGLIAHQWRQPLSAISATATGMQVKLELDNWEIDYLLNSLENIEKYVLHLSDTIDDFTNFFKPTKKRVEISIRDIIKKTLFIASPLLTKEGIKVIKKYSSTTKVKTYPNEIIQVLLNLIKNSANALKKNNITNPQIYISEYEKDSKFIIEVSDNAGGIEDNIMKKIFDPYFSTNNNEKSMGLGLYMSRFIIQESCGGTLEVKNDKFGAKFIITLDSIN